MIIVTGLPRSGTSLMMQVLFYLGIETFSDKISGTWNRKGFYENEYTLNGIDTSNYSNNIAVKVILNSLMDHSKITNNDKIIFCLRHPHQVAYSQMNYGGNKNFEQNLFFYHQGYEKFKKFKEERNIDVLFVDYDDTIFDTCYQMKRISKFLNKSFSLEKINNCIRNVDRPPAYDIYKEFYDLR